MEALYASLVERYSSLQQIQALWTLDGGGGATAENARLAISVSAADPDVKVIFV